MRERETRGPGGVERNHETMSVDPLRAVRTDCSIAASTRMDIVVIRVSLFLRGFTRRVIFGLNPLTGCVILGLNPLTVVETVAKLLASAYRKMQQRSVISVRNFNFISEEKFAI